MEKSSRVLKNIIKVIAFLVVFVLIFAFFQKIYHQRWTEEYKNFVNFEKTGQVDVVFIGTSEIKTGVSPAVIYDETGITSYNLAHTLKSTPVSVYEAEYAIKTHKPKIVALDFSALFSDTGPDESQTVFRLFLYAMPDKHIRRKFLKEVYRLYGKDSLSYFFPLLEFHNMWNKCEADFSKEYEYDAINPDFYLGWFDYFMSMRDDSVDNSGFEISPELWNVERRVTAIPEYSRRYYDKMVEMCNKEGVQIIAILPPKPSQASVKNAQIDAAMEYFNKNHIPCFNYNTYRAITSIGLDWVEDYYDASHLNCRGAVKWSKMIAADLKNNSTLEDHRGEDSEIAKRMDTWAEQFHATYDEAMSTW